MTVVGKGTEMYKIGKFLWCLLKFNAKLLQYAQKGWEYSLIAQGWDISDWHQDS